MTARRTNRFSGPLVALLLPTTLLFVGCGGGAEFSAGASDPDASTIDAGHGSDAGTDSGTSDAAPEKDSGSGVTEAGPVGDASPADGSVPESGIVDGSTPDVVSTDAEPIEAGPPDTGTPETCNGVDDDQDGQTDEDGAIGCRNIYVDSDGDKFGAMGSPPLRCSCSDPKDKESDNHNDCYDNNSSAKPGVNGWWDDDRGDGNYDYNCDKVEEPQFKLYGSCKSQNGLCKVIQGWKGAIPACGAKGSWISSCKHDLQQSGKCVPDDISEKTQTCH